MAQNLSKLWLALTSDIFSRVDEEFIANFRRPGGPNNRLAAWDPLDPTMRYFKFILFEAARNRSERFYHYYRKIGDTNVGNPISVRAQGININLDYLFSVDEFLFVDQNTETNSIKTVVEIGAGFGRTCQAFSRLLPKLQSYTIIDLPELLPLSRAVLTRAIPNESEKIQFLDATAPETWKELACDLAINIDSFQEMLPATIDEYFENIIRKAKLFYTKNPICKYQPISVGISDLAPAGFRDVFDLGYCRELADIFDEDKLVSLRPKFIELYRPKPSWTVLSDAPMHLVPYYHQVLYSA
ncbi:MAG: hypothetical protein CBB68_09600 [Rhodospirillaceae bacterium TMED8]|mgnify:CR=1 FL=1|nr:sugar methyltransferase [Magnetovibrio sp.]OUT50114.1 MAG: hypothetical protein CBB68_09600 [Rhodospirillaceae bacterium TMED8]|tara:strand:+ start:2380 stop:3276 length:897 start_codon:yes stop_codon:yes gene_type:complete